MGRTVHSPPVAEMRRPKVGDRAFTIRLMEHLVVPTFVLDAQRHVLIWNRACERVTGVPAAEVIGTSEHWRALYESPRPCLADLIALGRMEEIAQFYVEHVDNEQPQLGYYAENWCVMPRLGTRHYMAFDAGPIYDDNGNLLAVVETMRDMTAQREAETALQQLAASDGLTGLANRRRFDEALRIECQRASRHNQPFSLLMIDIDHFKSFNDKYGHQVGDACLKEVAKAMTHETLRATDLPSRYGGEEFAVILPATPLDEALVVGERIRRAVENLKLSQADSHIRDQITVSVGAAVYKVKGGSGTEQLIASADRALYAAKHAGRNRVVAFDHLGLT